jgi:hypothetical protein
VKFLRGARRRAYSAAMLGTGPLALVVDPGGPDDPPDWCFETNDDGDLPTCTYSGGEWHRSYDTGGVSDGFEATYLAANLRGQATPTAPPAGGKGTAERLRELRQLLDEGLITQEQYDARRRVVIGEV